MRKFGMGLIASLMAMVAMPAHAVLGTEAAAAFTEIQTGATDVLSATWGYVTIVVVGFAIISLVKRGLKKG